VGCIPYIPYSSQAPDGLVKHNAAEVLRSRELVGVGPKLGRTGGFNLQTGRAVTVPPDLNGRRVPPGFFDRVDFSGA
jgi:hypothetical protein